MTDIAWIEFALTAARPQALGALFSYFRDLDIAEEAFQEACLRALKTWPDKGPPRDPIAWLIFVGRNSGIDACASGRRRSPAGRGGLYPISAMPRPILPTGSTVPTIATTSCG